MPTHEPRRRLVVPAPFLGAVLGYLIGDLVAPTPIDMGGVIVQALCILAATVATSVALTLGTARWIARRQPPARHVGVLYGAVAALSLLLSSCSS